MSRDVLDVMAYDGTGFGRGHGPVERSGAEEVAVAQVKIHTRTRSFNAPVMKGITVAASPGVADVAAMAEYRPIYISFDSWISTIRLHQIKDGAMGSSILEVYRARHSVHILIATITLPSGGGNFTAYPFTMISDDLRSLKTGDYLCLQVIEAMGVPEGPVGFVDIHFAPT